MIDWEGEWGTGAKTIEQTGADLPSAFRGLRCPVIDGGRISEVSSAHPGLVVIVYAPFGRLTGRLGEKKSGLEDISVAGLARRRPM